ncbi:PAS domain S-box protein [Azospirillum doebereinerae]|uniref:PAS domain S-box protein n=1 Tax=Azospirillum doebereinerae TaxID=92933 RepID=UPI001EE54D84|nr:PAS domain S-box protein [Azospirillum doebereinerae]MCG5240715.1 PAS domain S-box protein [Azospirillum doebereinerae]
MIPRRQHRNFSIAVWMATLVMTAALWMAALMLAHHDGEEAMERAERDTGNLARVVAEHTTRAIAEADQIMLFLSDEFHDHGPMLGEDVEWLFRRAVHRSNLLMQIAIVNENGDLAHTTVEEPFRIVNLADREHVRIHMEHPNVGLFIGKPVEGRMSGKWAIPLTRRLTRADGSFAGVMMALLDPFYLSRTLDILDGDTEGMVSIAGKDGILRARSRLTDKIIGRDLSASATLVMSRRQNEGFLRTTSAIDGVVRLQSFRVLEDYPLLVTAAYGERAFLVETKHNQRLYMMSAAASTLGLFGLALLATRQSARLAAAGRSLMDSEQRFRDQAETASDWFWETDADLRFSRLIGPLVPQTDRGSVPLGMRRDEVAFRESGDEAKWAEHQRQLDRREPFRNFRYQVMTDNGLRYVSVSGRAVFDGDGVFTGYRGSATDITERELSAQRLQASEARYRAMFGAVAQPIITIDEHGVVGAFNPAAERLFGFGAAEVVGGTLRRLMPAELADIHDSRMEAYRTGKLEPPKSGVREMRGLRKDGSEFPVEVTLAGWREGERQYFTGAMRDITAQREIEASLRRAKEAADHANRMKGEFLATMSHEIRTPMNGVLGALTLVDGPNLDQEQRRLLEVARRSGNALLTILDDILDLSKLEAGKVEVEPVDFDLRAMLEDTVALLQPSASGRGLGFSLDVAPGVPARARADVRRIRQVLVNLIGNALKFTHRGAVTLRAGLDEAPKPDGGFLLRFEVVDTGIGIPGDVLPTLFRRFTQADGSITRKFGGTGLGLAISRELVTLMNGRIGAVSIEGKGSTFWFTVLCHPAAAPEEVPSMAPSPPGILAPSVNGLRVLIAEDNEINRDIVVAMLRRAGHRPIAVPDGLQAVRALEEESFDIVLMDVQMPVMDGITATRHIRAMPEPACGIPIVALTGNAMPGNETEYLAAGMNAYLSKPIVSAALFRTLTEVAASRRRPDAASTHAEDAAPPASVPAL